MTKTNRDIEGKKLLWSGVGRFGLPIARYCIQSGCELDILILDGHGKSGVVALEAMGVRSVSLPEVGNEYDALVLSVPRADDVKVIFSTLKHKLPPLALDLTTGDRETSADLSRQAGNIGAEYIDAPVSGSIETAGQGKLTVFVGAEAGQNILADLLIHLIGEKIFYFKHAGAGQAAKLVNQLVHITNMVTLVEGLALAKAEELDLNLIVAALQNASANSVMLERFGRSLVVGDFTPRFSLELACKDMAEVCRTMQRYSLKLQLPSLTYKTLLQAQREGLSKKDFSSIALVMGFNDSGREHREFKPLLTPKVTSMNDEHKAELMSVGGYQTVQLFQGLIFDDSAGMLPSRLLGYTGERDQEYGSDVSTTYGYVQSDSITLIVDRKTWGPIEAGYYFSVVGKFKVSSSGSAAFFERIGFRGWFSIGGPIETRGRLSYIDGCSDSLLIFPPRVGDPCINILWFPPNVRQTMHLHPSVRLAIVVYGEGRAITPYGELPLRAGSVFRLDEMSQHCFYTDSSRMGIITYHPDTDWGPTDANNPMLNRTLINTAGA